MSPKKISKKQIDAFFMSLKNRCNDSHTYSVEGTIQKMGVDYEQVKTWAASNKRWQFLLEWSKDLCADNAMNDSFRDMLAPVEACKSMLNCEDYREKFPTPESQTELIKKVKKHRSLSFMIDFNNWI